MKKKSTCFVIMGYGVKTDYATGRVLDLDKTYENIIKPAAEGIGLECKRADEIRHSGNIDVPMYQSLLSADIVIADLSTYNANAFYELGVRHALRPFTTIAIAESELKKPFDLDHTVIRSYEHLGNDIGYSEVIRFRKELQDTIKDILSNPQTDSPVYTFLSNLQQPKWENVDTSFEQKKESEQTLSKIIEKAKNALDKDNFIEAKTLFSYAHSLDEKSIYVIQKLALSTYKSKTPNHVSSLYEALKILEVLNLNNSTDPETLGLVGSIHKLLWEELNELKHLNISIQFYEKGFNIKKDYYNGINLAYLLNVRGSVSSRNNAIADYILANRIRKQVVKICEQLLVSSFDNRSDQYWIVATLEEALYGLGDQEKYLEIKKQAESLTKFNWERETTEKQIEKMSTLLRNSPLL